MACETTTRFACDLHSRKRANGMLRREAMKAAGAALAGTLLGLPVYRTVTDLSAVADAWIADASDIGMLVMRGPDGNLWRATAIDIPQECVEAQDRHWMKLNNRPRLLRAVHAAVEQANGPSFI